MMQALLLRLFALAFVLGLAWPAQGQVRVALQDGSRIWIEGSSNVNAFTCRAREIQGQGRVPDMTGTSDTDATTRAEIALTVPVRTFDCGKRQMNEDLYQALQVRSHPTIHYELDEAEVVARPQGTDATYRLEARGYLTIAGTTRPVTLDLTARRLAEGRFRAQGSLPLLMTDFGVEPPTALLGLVRAHDRIVVRFDLVAEADAPITLTRNSIE